MCVVFVFAFCSFMILCVSVSPACVLCFAIVLYSLAYAFICVCYSCVCFVFVFSCCSLMLLFVSVSTACVLSLCLFCLLFAYVFVCVC